MQLHVLSHPVFFPEEISLVLRFFEAGLDYFHIRKPHWTSKDMSAFIHAIPVAYRNRLVLHSHHYNVPKYDLGYIHFNPFGPATYDKMRWRCQKSIQLNNLYELGALDQRIDLVLFGPVFNSTRQEETRSTRYFGEDIKNFISENHLEFDLIALGGVKASNIAFCHELGFSGVAVMTEIWETYLQSGVLQAENTFRQIQNECNRIRYDFDVQEG